MSKVKIDTINKMATDKQLGSCPILPKKAVLEIAPYLVEAGERYEFVRLNYNENTIDAAGSAVGLPANWTNTYPEYSKLIAAISSVLNVSPTQVTATNGSDEAARLIAETFIEPGCDRAIVSKPCFAMFNIHLKLSGAEIIAVPILPDYSFNIKEMDEKLSQGAKLFLLASPDNPTGAALDTEQIFSWCIKYPKTLFVIDQAYYDYHPTNLIEKIDDYPNLLIIRTFSKSWGLAGLRLGAIVGHPQLIEYINRVRLPFNVNSAAVWASRFLQGRQSQVRKDVAATLERKAKLVQALQDRGFESLHGETNFLLLKVGIATALFCDFLKEEGVLVRSRSQGLSPADDCLWGTVRISTGTESENEKLLKAVDKFCRSYAIAFDLDGTLIDSSDSFDHTIATLVEQHTDRPLPPEELRALRMEGGFNNNWDAIVELINRRGKKVTRAEIDPEALAIYFKIAAERETALIDFALLTKLARRHPLFIVTGRSRFEYTPLWADKLNKHFERVICLDDINKCKPKPAPDYLNALLSDHKLRSAVYVGNAVDDIWSAKRAGIHAIGVATTHTQQVLKDAGADLTFADCNEVGRAFLL